MPEVPQRKSRRTELVGEVYYEVNHSQLLACWTDISRDGLFIQTMHPLPIGQQVKLKIRLPVGSKLYRAIGVVRHRLDFVGMGLEFTHLHPEATRLIEGFASRAEPGSWSPLPLPEGYSVH
jgi:PilZ domain-containing protein